MCLARVAGRFGITTHAAPFVPLEQASWNADATVLHHELGHALLWFFHGGGLGELKCTRAPDLLLEASVRVGPPPGQGETPEYIDAVAERLLAGEVAARRYLQMPGGRICLRKLTTVRLLAGARPDEVARDFAEYTFGPDGETILGDIAKVLMLAHDHREKDWRSWTRARLTAAEGVVSVQWASIRQVAETLMPRLPRPPGATFNLSAQDLIDVLRDCGAKPCGRPPVPI